MKGNRPAGGLGSKQVRKVGIAKGQPAHAMRPGGVSQIGSSTGDHATGSGKILRGAVEPMRGEQRRPGQPGSVELGNQCALNVGKGGPGVGRTLYGQGGTQGTHGSVAGSPRPQGRSFDAPAPATKRQEGY
jgi:hypothetical protein